MSMEIDLPAACFLTIQEREFVNSFGTENKPIEFSEFGKFWNSLSNEEKASLWHDYWDSNH